MSDTSATASAGSAQLVKRFPPPSQISAEAREFLNQTTDPAPFLFRPADDTQWKAIIPALNQARADQARNLISSAPVTVEEKLVAGVTTRLIVPNDQPAEKRSKLVIELHGGAYVLYAGEAGLTRAIQFAVTTGYSTLAVDYRMPPDHPFPCALDDTIAVYRALQQQMPTRDILLFGTSAGGHLALQLALRLAADNLPLPAAIALNSPWVDLSATGDTLTTLEGVDPALVTYHGVIEEAAKLFAGGRDLKSPEISPIYAEMPSDFPPVLLATGTRDLLLSDTSRLHMKLLSAGLRSQLLVFEGLWHGFSDIPEEHQYYQMIEAHFSAS